MELRRVLYKKVFGHLSGDLSFRMGENFLVGINGCGKTTVLNLIRWILTPSLEDLCSIEHEKISIEIKHEKYLYKITSRISDNTHTLSVESKDKNRNFKPIISQLRTSPSLRRKREFYKDMSEEFRTVSLESDDVDTWRFLLEDLPSPVFVGLGRSIADQSLYQPGRIDRLRARRIDKSRPVYMATELIRDNYNTMRRLLVEKNEDLNRKVLELSFSGVFSEQSMLPDMQTDLTIDKIKQLKQNYSDYSKASEFSKALTSTNVRTAILDYLQKLENLLSDTSKSGEDNSLWVMLNQYNLERASKMYDLFLDHENDVKKAQIEISTFSVAVNSFLKDSGKEIQFDQNTGTPHFKCGQADLKLSLSELSSGEAQILILLSYLAFLSKEGVPIIIDEPEISLHVEWQKQFVKAVKQVLPKDCQTVMATHSPEICGSDDVNVQAISVRN